MKSLTLTWEASDETWFVSIYKEYKEDGQLVKSWNKSELIDIELTEEITFALTDLSDIVNVILEDKDE